MDDSVYANMECKDMDERSSNLKRESPPLNADTPMPVSSGRKAILVLYVLLGISFLVCLILFAFVFVNNVLQLEDARKEQQKILAEMKMNMTELQTSKGLADALKKYDNILDEMKKEISDIRNKVFTDEHAKIQTGLEDVQKNLENLCSPSGWECFETSCYFFSSEIQMWLTAKKSCANKISQLVTINNQEELVFLKSKLNSQSWIGLSDDATEGKWLWVDGTAAEFKNFASNEPSGGKPENCALMSTDGKWHDFPCSDTFRSICEKKRVC